MINQYVGSTHLIPGATCFDTKAIVTIEEGYRVNGALEYVNIGDFKLENLTAEGEQQQRLSVDLVHNLDYSNNHSQLISSEFPSSIDYRTNFSNENDVNADFETSDGATITQSIGGGGLSIIQAGAKMRRFAILGKYRDITNAKIDMQFQRTTTTQSSREAWTVFRYRDETNYMYVKYGLGLVVLGDITNGTDTVLFTKSGVSIGADSYYYSTTVVHDDRVMNFGSSDGINYTKHIDLTNIYGNSWGAYSPFSNTKGAVGIETFGMSNGRITFREFRVSSLDNQYTYDNSLRHINAANNIFGVSIEREFSNMTDMMASPGCSWALSSNQAVRRVASNGTSWDTLFTNGNTFTDFVVEFSAEGSGSGVLGMAFGETNNFWGYYLGMGGLNESIERYNNARITTTGFGSFVVTKPNTENDFMMVKKKDVLSWFVNGLKVATVFGASSGDILNSPGRIGVFVWGQSSLGVTFIVNNFSISKLDNTVDSFIVEGNVSPRTMMDRFVPNGFAINTTSEGVNIIEKGSSRGIFTINSYLRNPMLSEKYSFDPVITSVRGDKYSNNLNSGISRSKIRADDSFISSYVDDNIKSTSDAKLIATTLSNDDSLNTNISNITFNAIPTLENYDRIAISDSTLGVSNVYQVTSLTKDFSANGSFNQSVILNRNGK